jgi:uncharacterized iron-regulated membrane protein
MRAAIRSVLFWMHLAVGLSAGLLILLMSVTGVMLGFERQMIASIDGAPTVESSSEARLPLDTLLARAGIERDAVASIVVKRDASQPVTVRLRERGAAPVMLDPYRASVLTASGDGSGQKFFSALRRWHRWIGVQSTELRAQMKVVAGVANLVFLLLVLSGIYLWWPRHWSFARLRATTVPQWHRSGKARDFNWHNSLGFWFAIPLALIVATAAFISFRWPGQYLDLALGNEKERVAAREALNAPPPPASSGATAEPEALPRFVREGDAGLAAYVISVESARPEWNQITITMPDARSDAARIAVAEGNTYRPDLRWTVEVDRTSANLESSSGYADLSPARRIRAWVRFGHTGEVFGLWGQFLATVASAVGVLLVWTGFALAWRRWRSWLKRRQRSTVMGTPSRG